MEEEGKEDDRECRQCFEVVFRKKDSNSDIERFFVEDNYSDN